MTAEQVVTDVPYKDLRDFITQVDKLGALRRIGSVCTTPSESRHLPISPSTKCRPRNGNSSGLPPRILAGLVQSGAAGPLGPGLRSRGGVQQRLVLQVHGWLVFQRRVAGIAWTQHGADTLGRQHMHMPSRRKRRPGKHQRRIEAGQRR